MYQLTLTDTNKDGTHYASTTTHVDFRKLNDTKGGEFDQVASRLISEGLDTDDVFEVEYVGFAAVEDHDTTSVFWLVQVNEETGEEEHAGKVTARNVTGEYQEAFWALEKKAREDDATSEDLISLIDDLANKLAYLADLGANVDSLETEVNLAFSGTELEFVWAEHGYEVRQALEDAA